MLEFSRQYQEERVVASIENDVRQLSTTEVDLEVRLGWMFVCVILCVCLCVCVRGVCVCVCVCVCVLVRVFVCVSV